LFPDAGTFIYYLGIILIHHSGNIGLSITSQEPGNEKMLAVVFKAQDFGRTELKDFEWEVKFNIVSATVYFSGTNFKNIEKGNYYQQEPKTYTQIYGPLCTGLDGCF